MGDVIMRDVVKHDAPKDSKERLIKSPKVRMYQPDSIICSYSVNSGSGAFQEVPSLSEMRDSRVFEPHILALYPWNHMRKVLTGVMKEGEHNNPMVSSDPGNNVVGEESGPRGLGNESTQNSHHDTKTDIGDDDALALFLSEERRPWVVVLQRTY